jgi:hypothetical protein
MWARANISQGAITMIDIANEQIISLKAAAKMLPSGRRGRPVNHATIFRWILDGVCSPSGEIVRLDAVRMGGRWITSVQALQRFVEAQTPDLSRRQALPRPLAQRRRAAKKAEEELKKLGI